MLCRERYEPMYPNKRRGMPRSEPISLIKCMTRRLHEQEAGSRFWDVGARASISGHKL